ncbi:unnamed protein product [Schistosoma haematobium]|nr:unnamed protein product [Schistosoma haematobium]
MSPAIHLSVKDELDKVVIEMMKGGYISIKKADQILDIFRARYPELPTSVRSVLRRCNDVEHKILDSGTYYHLGLKSSLLRISGHWLRRIRFNELQLQLNYDGLSLFKSSNQQLWPILGRIVAPLVSSVFVRTSTEGDKPLSGDIHHMFRNILKAVTELSSKMDRLIAVCERLVMGVSERRMEDTDSDAITFPLRTHDELRSLETALENKKFRDHFMGRLYHLLCDDLQKSAKACLKYLLSPELANTYTLHGTRSKFGISKYKFYSTVQSALCSHFRSASCLEQEIIHAMATASQAFLHDARDKVHKRGWRSKEGLASQALSDVTNIINDSSTST